MILKEQIIEELMKRYESKDMTSRLDKGLFKALFKEAVKDYYPKLKQQYIDQSIYGISFEIGNVVQRIYAEDFHTIIYFNTEELYQEKIEGCEEKEKGYYRFEAWAEWAVESAKSSLFDKVQAYLKQNSFVDCPNISDYRDVLEKEAEAWYEEHAFDLEIAFEKAFEEERKQIRLWVAESLGELRKEGFWEEQDNPDLYVIPFGGECDIEKEELEKTYHEMDLGCHGTEYLDYLEYLDEM